MSPLGAASAAGSMTPSKTGTPSKQSCPTCGKVFARTQDLNRHRRVHTGERPFVCRWPRCGKAFSQSGHLKRHAQMHSGPSPHMCPRRGCRRRFREAAQLEEHARTHTDPLPGGGGAGGPDKSSMSSTPDIDSSSDASPSPPPSAAPGPGVSAPMPATGGPLHYPHPQVQHFPHSQSQPAQPAHVHAGGSALLNPGVELPLPPPLGGVLPNAGGGGSHLAINTASLAARLASATTSSTTSPSTPTGILPAGAGAVTEVGGGRLPTAASGLPPQQQVGSGSGMDATFAAARALAQFTSSTGPPGGGGSSASSPHATDHLTPAAALLGCDDPRVAIPSLLN